MTKKKIHDPLDGVDPVMQDMFSQGSSEEGDLPTVSQIQFPTLTEVDLGKKVESSIFTQIPVTVSVELGRSEIPLKEIFELSEGSIIELERLVGEPLDLVVNGQVIAQGEVVAVDNHYGIRLTQIISKFSV